MLKKGKRVTQEQPTHNNPYPARPPEDDEIHRAALARAKPDESSDDTEADADAQPKGSGWTGWGEPLRVRGKAGKLRPLWDGGGLCSPGKWAPGQRRLPGGTVKDLGNWMVHELRKLNFKRIAQQAFDQELKGDPFPAEATARIQSRVKDQLERRGFDSRPKAGDYKQEFECRMMKGLMEEAQDPDAIYFDKLAKGVRVGVGITMPRTPAVFRKKRKWALWGKQGSEDQEGEPSAPNYKTALMNKQWLRKHVSKEKGLGHMVSINRQKARERYGARLKIGAMGCIEKGAGDDGEPDFRLIHDGSNQIRVNHEIRQRDLAEVTQARDVRRATSWQADSKMTHFGLTADISHAHRIPRHVEEDWGLMACQIDEDDEDLLLNVVGTFGITTAGYYWERLGAAAQRAYHYILQEMAPAWCFRVADDFEWRVGGPDALFVLVLGLWTLVVFGLPISWAKVRGGLTYDWVGYQACLKEYALGLSEKRATWLCGWYEKVLADNGTDLGDLRDVLGRAGYAYAALVYDRAFMSPLYQFVAVHGTSGWRSLPLYVRLTVMWLRDRLRARRMLRCEPQRKKLGMLFRVDAKAEGDLIVLGAWEPHRCKDTGLIIKGRSRWFSIRLTRRDAPWAYFRGSPYRAISALELLATTMALHIFGWPERSAEGTHRIGDVLISAGTDSQVASRVAERGVARTFPMCCVAMELAAILEERGMWVHNSWIPRELNEEADALTNECFEGFEARLRIPVELSQIKWKVLPNLLAYGLEWHKEHPHKDGDGRRELMMRGKKRPLKVREPW